MKLKHMNSQNFIEKYTLLKTPNRQYLFDLEINYVLGGTQAFLKCNDGSKFNKSDQKEFIDS